MSKFEVGDTVKVVKLDCKWKHWCPVLANYIGKTGKIKRNDTWAWSEIIYCVQFDDDWWYFPEDWLELVEKAEKYWTGKVVCTKGGYEKYFVKGKVYKVKNGRIFGENHCEFQTELNGPVTFLNLNYYISPFSYISDEESRYVRFVEFIGFADDNEGNDKK